jgi:hypothetical protein
MAREIHLPKDFLAAVKQSGVTLKTPVLLARDFAALERRLPARSPTTGLPVRGSLNDQLHSIADEQLTP